MLQGASSESDERDLDRKFWVALALYAVLAVLVWFTMGEGKVLVVGRPVELRLVPLIVIWRAGVADGFGPCRRRRFAAGRGERAAVRRPRVCEEG